MKNHHRLIVQPRSTCAAQFNFASPEARPSRAVYSNVKGLWLFVATVSLLLWCTPRASAQYIIDDGTAEEEIGNGKTSFDFVFLNSFKTDPTRNVITSISIAFGSTPEDTILDAADGFPTNGVPITAILWSDPNGDGKPSDAHVLTTTPGFTALHGTSQFVTYFLKPTLVTTENFFVGYYLSAFPVGFPAAEDEDGLVLPNRSFIAGGYALGSGDYYNLLNNEFPVASIEASANLIPGNWLIRADGIPSSAVPEPATYGIVAGLGCALLALRRSRSGSGSKPSGLEFEI